MCAYTFKPKSLNKEVSFIKAHIQSKGAKVLGLQRTEKDMEKSKKHQYFVDFTTLTLEYIPFVLT